MALPFTLKGFLRQKKNYENSNISPCKNINFEKSSKENHGLVFVRTSQNEYLFNIATQGTGQHWSSHRTPWHMWGKIQYFDMENSSPWEAHTQMF